MPPKPKIRRVAAISLVLAFLAVLALPALTGSGTKVTIRVPVSGTIQTGGPI
ncbi:hypothetical protein [Cohnella sp. REN36]|uniref:hypothetical protein n=1 Tax=Cohnella sp. REN36 TaxID=2887347 RepID=UPI001D155076|nr:hypothetical protein [Cohnella sp. REN36]MCC3375454.1 hypothetical protein [Cohnella sp. REN36]